MVLRPEHGIVYIQEHRHSPEVEMGRNWGQEFGDDSGAIVNLNGRTFHLINSGVLPQNPSCKPQKMLEADEWGCEDQRPSRPVKWSTCPDEDLGVWKPASPF